MYGPCCDQSFYVICSQAEDVHNLKHCCGRIVLGILIFQRVIGSHTIISNWERGGLILGIRTLKPAGPSMITLLPVAPPDWSWAG